MEMSNDTTSRIAAFLDAGYEAKTLLAMAREGAAIEAIAKEARRLIERHVEKSTGDSLSCDLAMHALRSVEWFEIAQMFLDEVQSDREYAAIASGENFYSKYIYSNA